MSLVSTYRSYIYSLTSGVEFLRGVLGRFYSGTMATVTDALLEGARQAFIQGLPGHPEQLDDSLSQVGADRQLFRYRGESRASWSARVQNAWLYYEQAGTDVQVLRAINEWGAIVFPASWSVFGTTISEGAWANFTVIIGAGLLPWTSGGALYGSGVRYGDAGLVYGLSGALLEDVDTLRRIVRKWKPARSRAFIQVFFSGGGSVTLSV